MKKITCNVLLILFTLIVAPLLSVAQVKTDLDNQDSLIHYLKMDQHPDYPEVSAFYIHKIIAQKVGNYTTDLTLDVALKIIKVKDVEDYANVILPKFTNGAKLKDLKITTYNLENGSIQIKELNKQSLQETKIENDQSIQLVSASKVKNGSILRFQLNIKGGNIARFFVFQDALPIIYSAFELNTLKSQQIRIEEKIKMPFKEFNNINEFNGSSLPATLLIYSDNKHTTRKWIRRNVPPFKVEAFTSKQTLEQISFSFTRKETERSKKKNAINELTWEEYNTELYSSIYIHAFAKNDYLYKLLPSIIDKEKDSFKIAQKIFTYVQENFSIASDSWTTNFEEIVKDKKGTNIELNQLLCALYRHAGLASDLVYISTDRKSPLSPQNVQMNDIAIAVRIILNGVSYFCAPAQKSLPFGYLPYSFYNGYTRLINKTGGEVILTPELAKNKYNTEVNITPIDSLPHKFKINFTKNFGIYASIYERSEYKKDSLIYKDFYKKKLESLSPNQSINNFSLKTANLTNIQQPFIVTAEAEIEFSNNSDILFLDPFLQKVYNGENPFQKIKDRNTDVEMDYCYNSNYILRFHLNDYFNVDELPSNSSLQYANPSTIKYYQNVRYNAQTNIIEINYNYDIIPVFYAPEEVADLNAFYTEIMKALNQKLLLNKK